MKRFLALLALATASPFLLSQTIEQEARSREIPFQLLDHLIVVNASAPGLPVLRVVIDTGTSHCTVSKRLVKKLGLEKDSQSALLYAFGKTTRAKRVILRHLRMGPIFTTMVCYVAEVPDPKVDAFVGISLLQRYNFTIDYTRKSVRFGPREHFRASIPFRLRKGYATVELDAGDETLELVLDTGAPTLVLDGDKIGPVRSTPILRPWSLGVGSIQAETQLRDVRLGPAEWKKLRTMIFYLKPGSPRPRVRRETDGMLGLAGLHFKRVYFDFTHHQLSWEN